MPVRLFQRRPALDILITALAVLFAVRASVLFIEFVLAIDATQRFHVETAFVWFVLTGIIAVAIRKPRPEEPQAAPPKWSLGHLPLLWALAILLYWPALFVGFLSDDFVLQARAVDWQLGAVHPALFRPLTMAVWSVLEGIGASIPVYHLLNVLLHGTNAFLSGLVISGWTRRRDTAAIGALLVLVAPVAVEAVVWVSGLFDVLMTSFVLATVLVYRAYERTPSSGLLLVCVGSSAAAILSKETGVVVAALIVCDALARRSRTFLRSPAFFSVAALAVAYSVLRVGLAFGAAAPSLNKYIAQRMIFQTFGALADPWHVAVLRTRPGLVLLFVLVLVALLARFVVTACSRSSLRIPVAACLWILLSILPVGPILFIPGDLQASRYLYLAACGWAGLLCFVAYESSSATDGRRWLPASALVLLIALSIYSTRQNIHPWTTAGAVRERVLGVASADPAIGDCQAIALVEVPDSVDGAYVFRNGVAEAFARRLGISVVSGAAPPECSFRWDTDRGQFVNVELVRSR